MEELAVFSFNESYKIRVHMIGGEPWFVAKDVCEALGLTNSRMTMKALDDDEKGVSSTYTLGGKQDLGIISEPGLYTLILRCRDAVTPGTIPYKFRKWVTAEVLPSIRKTGIYQFTQEAPKQAGEPLARRDHDELVRLINDVSRSFHFNRRWVAAIWYALRRSTGNPSPNPILTTDLPVIIHELRRILEIAECAGHHMRRYELDLLKTIRDGSHPPELINKSLDTEAFVEPLPGRLEMALQRLAKLDSDRTLAG
ncbi:Bro-N domain-containing protein [Serratia liquefaciens]|uniref:BRO-N domain-containing protein n=1 Tax=Serratia liquefaciens TaxID=614 RepID=UPI0039677553